MAKWILYLNSRECITALYKNVIDGATFACGELRLDTPTEMIVSWVVNQTAAQTFDLIRLPNGITLQLQPAPRAIQ